MRTEPEINLEAAQAHMTEGFPIIDPDGLLGKVQLAGIEMHGFASAHLAASHRALWRRVAELEVTNERLRKIAAHVPGKVYIEAKEAAGFGAQIVAK